MIYLSGTVRLKKNKQQTYKKKKAIKTKKNIDKPFTWKKKQRTKEHTYVCYMHDIKNYKMKIYV